jgi:hypothetical protein
MVRPLKDTIVVMRPEVYRSAEPQANTSDVKWASSQFGVLLTSAHRQTNACNNLRDGFGLARKFRTKLTFHVRQLGCDFSVADRENIHTSQVPGRAYREGRLDRRMPIYLAPKVLVIDEWVGATAIS